MAPGTIMVSSIIGMPPAQTARAASIACSGEEARTTGTIPISMMRRATSDLVIYQTRRAA
jgi:hypothetical protein